MTARIVTAASIITMDDQSTRARAMAVDEGRIVAVGTLDACRERCPDAEVTDLGDSVLMPGFVDTHNHPVLCGMAVKPPAIDISPWNVATWDEIVAIGRRAAAEAPEGASLMLFGLDQLLHGCPFPTAVEMDEMFGDRIATIIALSQHKAAITTATMRELGWLDRAPEDPMGASFGRAPDGSMLGTADEIPAVFAVIEPVFRHLGGHPLEQAAMYMAELASVGLTASAETGYVKKLGPAYDALCSLPDAPLRMMLYEQVTEDDAGAPLATGADPAMLRKTGLKMFADGTPWLGTIATSFPYLDTETVRSAGIPSLHPGTSVLNYTREEVDAILDAHADQGWQMACHVNGDLAIDLMLDAYEAALRRHGLLGTDHRWRLEHVGAVRDDQLERMARLGVVPTFGLFQYMQWGDLLDGGMYAPEHGARWASIGDALRHGHRQSYHNDGNISRPLPIANVQSAVTRRCNSRHDDGTYGFADGNIHGPEQQVPLHEALRAITINAAYCLKRDHEIGSLEVGKYADFVELSADPYLVDPHHLVDEVRVTATWLNGRRVDTDAFVAQAAALEATDHHHEVRTGSTSGCNHR